jgi:hypothetical protein
MAPFAWWGVSAVVFATLAALLATSTRYGYQRDELYFRLLGERLDWGYIDNGPATPLVARLAAAVFGDSLTALRVPAALLAAATVVFVALLAREMGGGKRAQLMAAAATALSVFPLTIGHTLHTATLDVPISVLMLLFVVRAVRRSDGRWWLAAGTAFGFALYSKLLVVLIALGLLVGVLVAGPRSVFRDRFFWAGAALAVVIGVPNIIYQMTHGWPELSMAAVMSDREGPGNRISLLPWQLALIGPFLLPVWIGGLVALIREQLGRLRAIGIAYLASLAIVLLTGGQSYYLVPLMLALLAAGCVVVDRWIDRKHWRLWAFAVATALNGVFAFVVALPVLPLGAVANSPLPAASQFVADQIGWPELTAQVNAAYQSVPPQDRPHTIILTGNYGQAGALDRFGQKYGLPRIYSGHNQLFEYGPPPEDTTTVIAVGFRPADIEGVGLAPDLLSRTFAECRLFSTISNDSQVKNEEIGRPIEVCRQPRTSWSAMWPTMRHFD